MFITRSNLWFSFFFFPLLFGLISSQTNKAMADTYTIDPAHSSIQFSIKHLGFSYTTGRFDNIDGIFSFNEARDIKSAKAKVFVKVGGINTNHEERDSLLRGFSFFNVSKHPIAMFKTTSVSTNADKNNSGSITGKLTLKGVTRTETFNLEYIGEGRDPWLGYRMGFKASGTIQRSNYNLDFMEGAIGDEVHVTVFIEGVKQ